MQISVNFQNKIICLKVTMNGSKTLLTMLIRKEIFKEFLSLTVKSQLSLLRSRTSCIIQLLKSTITKTLNKQLRRLSNKTWLMCLLKIGTTLLDMSKHIMLSILTINLKDSSREKIIQRQNLGISDQVRILYKITT